MTDDLARRAETARRAALAVDEFLAPAFATARQAYSDRLSEVCATRPWAANEIAALANAVRVVDEVEIQLNALVADGDVVRSAQDMADRIAAMSPAKRRLLSIGRY